MGGKKMTNLLNEEIRVIQHTMAHLKRAIPLEQSSGKRYRMEQDYKQLGEILEEKVNQCEDYKG